jgi:hypothetical protein
MLDDDSGEPEHLPMMDVADDRFAEILEFAGISDNSGEFALDVELDEARPVVNPD